MSDYVYSELNRNLVNVDYEGVKTDSARVTVDNGQRTIAVDFTRLPKSLFIEDGSAIREYNGSEELRININDYFIREIETTEFAKKYALFIGDSEVVQGASIEIPFSDSLKGVAMRMCETAGIPLSGLAVGDFYLEFTLDSGKLFCALGGLQSFANNKVEAEKTRAMAAESELSGDLADESARASLAEEALSNRLIAEESARESGDRELSGYISDETAARQAADSALSDRVTALETYKTTVQNTYAPKSVLEVDSGKLDSIAMSRITKYKFIVCHGYKFGVSAPNQADFVLMPQLIAAGTADVSVYCSALGSDSDAGWPFKIRFSCGADGQTLSWYTYPTYGDSSEKGKFYVTQILGVY